MRYRLAAGSIAISLCLGLAGCSRMGDDVLTRNASGADLLVRPLSAMVSVLKAGESRDKLWIAPLNRQEALLKRGDCLYTYPAPDVSQLPKTVRAARLKTVVIHEDMRMSLHVRSEDGTDGPEVLVAGFPLRPTTFCGREAS